MKFSDKINMYIVNNNKISPFYIKFGFINNIITLNIINNDKGNEENNMKPLQEEKTQFKTKKVKYNKTY